MIKFGQDKKRDRVVYQDTWPTLTAMVEASDDHDVEWHGGTSAEIASTMRKGDAELAKAAEKDFDKCLGVIMPEAVGEIMDRDTGPVGCFPNVPAFIQGRPDSMWRQTWEEAPSLCRIYVQANVQADATPEAARMRGVAVAALAYATQTHRPVELYWFAMNRRRGAAKAAKLPGVSHLITCLRLGTAPLDMSRIAVALARVGIFRKSLRRVAGTMFGGYSDLRPETVFDIGPDDVVIPAVHHGDVSAINNDALAWVLARVADQEGSRRSTFERGRGAWRS